MTNRRTTESETQLTERSEGSANLPETAWSTTALFPPTNFECLLRIGHVAETSHVQWQLEVYVPNTRELLAMASVPHRNAQSPLSGALLALHDLEYRLRELLDPDPF